MGKSTQMNSHSSDEQGRGSCDKETVPRPYVNTTPGEMPEVGVFALFLSAYHQICRLEIIFVD